MEMVNVFWELVLDIVKVIDWLLLTGYEFMERVIPILVGWTSRLLVTGHEFMVSVLPILLVYCTFIIFPILVWYGNRELKREKKEIKELKELIEKNMEERGLMQAGITLDKLSVEPLESIEKYIKDYETELELDPLELKERYGIVGDEKLMGVQDYVIFRDDQTITQRAFRVLKNLARKNNLIRKIVKFPLAEGRLLITTKAFVFEGIEVNHRIEWNKVCKIFCGNKTLRINFRNGTAQLYQIDESVQKMEGQFVEAAAWFARPDNNGRKGPVLEEKQTR